MNISTFDVEVVSDVYVAGRTEDGVPYTAEVYFVTAVAPDGRRWNHFKRFHGCAVHLDEEGFQQFEDIREPAKAAAERVEARVLAAREIDLAYWSETYPVYGSEAYQAQAGEIAARDRAADMAGDFGCELARVG